MAKEMPDISLLEPVVIRDVVQKLPYPDALVMSKSLPRTPWPFPSVTWDVMKGSRNVAKPNVPNSEAHIVPKLGYTQESAAFVYTREKKVFEPTTLHWLKAPGTLSNLQNAEQAVMRELTDLNLRCDNFVEWCCWQALTGTLAFDYPDVQASVDYKFPATHVPEHVAQGWDDATPVQIVNMVTAWKRMIARDGRVAARTAYLTPVTMDRVFTSWLTVNVTSGIAPMLSDRMRDQYYSSGVLPGFMGLDWNIVENYYDTDAGTPTLFLPDDALIFGNLTDNNPIEIMEGPTADDEAPEGFTGKFTKTWKEKDPSARQVLLEYHFLPVIRRPEQFVYIADVKHHA